MLLGELRPLKPERPVDDIRLAIFVDVAKVGPFGKVDLGELLSLEPMDAEVLGHNVSQRHHTAHDQTTERGNRTETHEKVSREVRVGKRCPTDAGSMPSATTDNKPRERDRRLSQMLAGAVAKRRQRIAVGVSPRLEWQLLA